MNTKTKQDNGKLKIEWRNPSEITPYHNNPKKHPDRQLDKIASSIAEFKFDQPIVVDAKGVIIKGHGRREAAIRIGLNLVPVIARDDLSPAQVKAARIADNKTAESEWDFELLQDEIALLKDEGFDLSLTGFDMEELGIFDIVDGKEYDESAADDVKYIECPECGHKFPK